MGKTWLWWSSGKDSTWALRTLRGDPRYTVDALVTTINAAADRVAMHAVRTELVRAQAEAVGLPLHIVEIPYPCPNGAYEAAAGRLIEDAEGQGVTHMAFGDLFLEDIRAYRENLLGKSPIEPIFPLWQRDTGELAWEMLDDGIGAVLTCIDPKVLDRSFVGRTFDQRLLEDLPTGVDPCGENGEFHTFVHTAPGFASPVGVEVGEVVERGGFVFADVLPHP
ncbi:MAG: ATP-binding protein [Acidobacteriota bacterium]